MRVCEITGIRYLTISAPACQIPNAFLRHFKTLIASAGVTKEVDCLGSPARGVFTMTPFSKATAHRTRLTQGQMARQIRRRVQYDLDENPGVAIVPSFTRVRARHIS